MKIETPPTVVTNKVRTTCWAIISVLSVRASHATLKSISWPKYISVAASVDTVSVVLTGLSTQIESIMTLGEISNPKTAAKAANGIVPRLFGSSLEGSHRTYIRRQYGASVPNSSFFGIYWIECVSVNYY